MANKSSNHVHILSMGGTIDKDYPRLTSGYAFEFGEESAAARILKAHPNLGVTFDVTSICKKDSLEVTDTDRSLLYDAICNIRKTVPSSSQYTTRIVVTHGTGMYSSCHFLRYFIFMLHIASVSNM